MESIRNLPDYCGIVANRGQSPTETRNTTWRDDPKSPWYNKPYRDATFLERYPETTKYPIDGERAEVFWTDIFKNILILSLMVKISLLPVFHGTEWLTMVLK